MKDTKTKGINKSSFSFDDRSVPSSDCYTQFQANKVLNKINGGDRRASGYTLETKKK